MPLPSLFRARSSKSLVFLAACASAFLLGFALVSQYGFGLRPCELCIAQRVPYAIIMGIGLISFFIVKSDKPFHLLALLCGLLFAVDGSIALYHAGVEAGLFTGPSGCTNHPNPDATIEEMRAAIRNAALVPCDQPMAHVLGLSMAAWNALAAWALALFTLLSWRWLRRES